MRQDTRKHTKHCLRPDALDVATYLQAPSPAAWRTFAAGYRRLLRERFAADRAPFDALADAAMANNVFLGCNCPTTANPDVRRCHTWLALEFLAAKYPQLDVRFPEA